MSLTNTIKKRLGLGFDFEEDRNVMVPVEPTLRSILKDTPQFTIAQAPKDSFWEKVKSKLEPVTEFLTGLKARERQLPELGTTIRLPFAKKEVTMPISPIIGPGLAIGLPTELAGRIAEWPVRFATKRVADVQEILSGGTMARGIKVPGAERLGFESEQVKSTGRSIVEEFYRLEEKAPSTNNTDMFKNAVRAYASKGAWEVADVMIMGDLLSLGAKLTLRGTEKFIAQKGAWETLGMPVTQKEAQTQFRKLAHIHHPDIATGNEELFKQINDAWKIIKQQGIPSKTKLKTIPTVREYAMRLISPVGAKVESEAIAYSAISGYLPGTIARPGQARPLGFSMEERVMFRGFEDVTTKTLEKLKGRTSVSKQFISNLTNAPDLKQAERILIRAVLEGMPDNVSVQEFADRVKQQLLPLRAKSTDYVGLDESELSRRELGEMADAGITPARYENIALSPEQRGNIANYFERIYESPIKTSAGEIHFADSRFAPETYEGEPSYLRKSVDVATNNYFAHTRIEDLADLKGLPEGAISRTWSGEQSGVRRVIEIQSDLFQKGALEREISDQEIVALNNKTLSVARNRFIEGTAGKELLPFTAFKPDIEQVKFYGKTNNFWGGGGVSVEVKKGSGITIDEAKQAVQKAQKQFDNRVSEIARLQPYRNIWHERIIREEIKRAAQDGKTKLLFPTGETAMKIEGLGEIEVWYSDAVFTKLISEKLKIGLEIERSNQMGPAYRGQKWIITDVLGDGKFKAVQKNALERFGGNVEDLRDMDYDQLSEMGGLIETFDISGKIDTSNPIYRFYEKEVQKYLNRVRPETKRITDPQGVEWFETPINKADSKKPIEAFGALAGFETDEDGNIRIDPLKAGLGVFAARISRGKGKPKGGKVVGKLTKVQERAILEASAAKEIGGASKDMFDDIIAGRIKMRPPTDIKNDWRETIGKGHYMKMFKKDSNLPTPDEMADSLNMTENELLEAIDVRMRETVSASEIPSEILDWGKQEVKMIKKTPEYEAISEELKEQITAFFRPTRRRNSRAFSLLGNKDTTIPLFNDVFSSWAKSGHNIIVEPYAGAYTLGTHSLNSAIKSGLKEFHSNIFDKEKYIIVKAIQGGKLKEVEETIKASVKDYNDRLRFYAKDSEVEKYFNEFFEKYPDSYIGSKQWLSYIRGKDIGKEVTIYKDRYEIFRDVFQKASDELFGRKVDDLQSAITNSLIKRIGVFGGKGQGLLNTNGFVPYEDKIFGKYGMLHGFTDMDTTFKLAQKHATKISLYSEDGVSFVNKFSEKNPKEIAFYLDPPYVKSSQVYADQLSTEDATALEKFTSGQLFYDNHKTVFDMHKKGASIALTNDVDQEYLDTMLRETKDTSVFAYKEGNTPTSLVADKSTGESINKFLKESEKVVTGEVEEIARIKELAGEKSLSSNTVASVRHGLGIKELKNATPEQLDKMIEVLANMEYGDSLLTPLQRSSLKGLYTYGSFDKPIALVTKREFQIKFREQTDLLQGRVSGLVAKQLFPTVDIKEGHPIITRTVDRADYFMRKALKDSKDRSIEIADFQKRAMESEKLPKKEINKKMFMVLGGMKSELTKEQAAVVAYAKNFFKEVARDTRLEKTRKYYVTHIDRELMEKIVDDGIHKAVASYLKPRDVDIPVEILANLEYIIGSEKFFRFALERTGGLKPTMDIERIINEYGQIYEMKMALDAILPEAQAAQQLLLQDRSALWMKGFLQNLKGRGLDVKFRNGDMGWMAKTADRVVDIGYIRLLGLNYWSALKNVVGGEVNSFVYQGFKEYLTGKQRMMAHPIEAIKFITDCGVLQGSYADLARSTLIKKGRRVSDIVLYGGMEMGEYEIRGTYLLGNLTKDEWGKVLSGAKDVLTPQRFRETLDGIAITQGIYTKVDSPLFVQTWYGRMMMQFGRWRITNAMLARRIAKSAIKEIKAGEYYGTNTRRVLKMIFSYGMMMYMGYQLGKKGYKRGQKIALAGAELINNIFGVISGEILYDAVTRNPTIDTLGSIVYTIQNAAAYIGIAEEPYPVTVKKGITDIYIAALRTLGITKKKEEETVESGLPMFPGLPTLPQLPSLPKL